MNTKQIKLQNYLLDNIDFTGYNRDWAIMLDTINNVYIQCMEEYWHNRSNMWEVETVKQWLLWLPSCLSIAFSYYDISKILLECWYKETTNQKYQDTYYWKNLAKIICNS